jgi:hypothetical protein
MLDCYTDRTGSAVEGRQVDPLTFHLLGRYWLIRPPAQLGIPRLVSLLEMTSKNQQSTITSQSEHARMSHMSETSSHVLRSSRRGGYLHPIRFFFPSFPTCVSIFLLSCLAVYR